MKVPALFALIMSIAIPPVYSQESSWVWGVEVQSFSTDADYFGVPVDLRMDALTVFVGYHYAINNKWAFTPSVYLGTGINDDSDNSAIIFGDIISDFDAGIDSIVSLTGTLSYQVGEHAAIQFRPSIVRHDIALTPRSFGEVSDQDWHLGLGVGLMYKISPTMGLNLAYDVTDNSDIVSGGVTFNF